MKTFISLAALLAFSAPLSFASSEMKDDDNSFVQACVDQSGDLLQSEECLQIVDEEAVLRSNNCSYYVKPATCLSHKECKWTGSCVPR